LVLGLGLGSRRRAITLVASALAAVAFAAAVAGRGCSVEDDSPEGAARAFVEAARAGDRQAVFELLGPETRAKVARASQRATELVGGGTRFEELDLVGLGKPSETAAPKEFVVKRRVSAEEAGAERGYTLVDVVDANGARSELRLVEISGNWRVEIPDYPDVQ
jgi:hypothetical protein